MHSSNQSYRGFRVLTGSVLSVVLSCKFVKKCFKLSRLLKFLSEYVSELERLYINQLLNISRRLVACV